MSNEPTDEQRDLPTPPEDSPPLASWFLGPKAEQADTWRSMLNYIFQDYVHWRRNYFPDDPVVISRARRRKHEEWYDRLNTHLDSILGELKAHFPFYSPRYIGHMLSEQTLPSVLGYFAGMLYNPNNVTDEAAPVTVRLELEVGKMISQMLGYNPRRSWAHVCSGGTSANLEALWVARTVQFMPLIVQEYCKDNQIAFRLKTPNGKQAYIADLSPPELVELKPNEAIFMLRKLARHLIVDIGRPEQRVLAEITSAVRMSCFNPANKGIHSVVQAVGKSPVIYVSAAAHYSIRKAANVLGYGEDAVRSIPVTDRFRLDVNALAESVNDAPSDTYIAAVIGIAGTTEEGAVDPLHEIRFLQSQLCRDKNRSFWFHVDAAWGGYVRSLFCGHSLPSRKQNSSLDTICSDYAKAINAYEAFLIKVDGGNSKRVEMWWNNPEIYKAFLAISDADSVTVDPHKMGYIPYPAGVVAFRNGLVTELVTQKAQYISEEREGIKSIDEPTSITAVGPYVLEGSKPGASAAACWLAHTAIPLVASGHGKIIRTSMLNARKLTRYLLYHRHMFHTLDEEVSGLSSQCLHPFTFVPLNEPDTNVVCFVAIPMVWRNDELAEVDIELERVNNLNELIYRRLSIPGPNSDNPHGSKRSRLPYGQCYFVSRTRFEKSQYSYASLEKIMDRLGIDKKKYDAHGLFVLRSTVMNPLYHLAEKEGTNYLLEFVKYLHEVARENIRRACWADGTTT